MSARKKDTRFPQCASVVGTIHSPGALRHALKLRPGEVDFLELRIDHFAADPRPLLEAAPHLSAPLIATVRHPAEGGAVALKAARRRELYAQFLPLAALLDVELRSCTAFADIIASAQARGIHVIVSDHYFLSTPSLAHLRKRLAGAAAAGAGIFKVAALASASTDLETLLALLHGKRPTALSVMGMGAFGKISRLLLACAGSLLNYGYLDRPQVPGQWEATLLKKRIAELLAA